MQFLKNIGEEPRTRIEEGRRVVSDKHCFKNCTSFVTKIATLVLLQPAYFKYDCSFSI